MFCKKCGNQILDEAVICVHCGCSTQDKAVINNADDAPSAGMAFLGFFIPLVGFIVYLMNHDTKPLLAKSAGKGALFGFVFGIVFIGIIYGVILGGMLGEMMFF